VSAPEHAVVVVPIRSFSDAKSRLSERFTPDERARMMQSMAERVVDAAGPAPVVVVSSAPEVERWARTRGIAVIPDPGALDAAADAGRAWAVGRGALRVVIAHADLPLVQSLERLTAVDEDDAVVAVPCHRDDGTPILSIPATAAFRFAYGPGSFARHVAEAKRAGLDVVELRDDPALRHDVDAPEDLAHSDHLLA